MTIQNTPFLRNTLIADAGVGLAAAALTIFGASFLSPLLNLPQGLIFWAGVALLPVAALLIAAARRSEIPRFWLREIVFINVAWVIASFGILIAGLVQPNALGIAFIVAQALAVGLFAELQYIALRRSRVADLQSA
ncbi:hypothetical protein ABFT80_27270 [Mesorhizobium sp. SB112]|uniref:hypothetical protein n=1 Tax=Mesorhizobium sp. SB112 TaxID=3151853 RepID=UPI0032634AAB